MGFWSINILSYYRISHVYPIPYTHISLFEFNQLLFSPSKCDASSPDFFSVQKPTKAKRCLFTFLPHVFFGAQWFFDWANRHVPRKNVFEQIESTIGKSDLGEKAWCLKAASGSLLVMSNLEESTYRYGPDMYDTFCVSPASHVHGLVRAGNRCHLLSSEQLLSYSSCCSGLFQSWGTISVPSPRQRGL